MDMLPVEIQSAERLLLGADEIQVLATGETTGGDIFAVLLRMPSGGGPPVLHRHAPGEVYHVLDGEFTFYVGSSDGSVQRLRAPAGTVMPLAGGLAHTIRNETDRDATAFVVHSPAAPMERFSREAAVAAADGPPKISDVLAIAERHGIEMLGPIPSLP